MCYETDEEITPAVFSRYFATFLDLERKPVGIRFLYSEEDYHAAPFPAYEGCITYCTAVRNASTMLGETASRYKLNVDNFACTAAAIALGFAAPDPARLSGSRHYELGVYHDITVSHALNNDMTLCHPRCSGVAVAPLENYTEPPPDIVLLITDPYHAMRIAQGYAFHKGYLKNIHLSGMCALCAECTAYPYEMRDINISLLCSGTRAMAQWKHDELALGFPYELIGTIIDGIVRTSNPMDLGKEKRRIEEKLPQSGLEIDHRVEHGKNYFTNAYRWK
jgi:uncharacterized protein (DUF169 family)